MLVYTANYASTIYQIAHIAVNVNDAVQYNVHYIALLSVLTVTLTDHPCFLTKRRTSRSIRILKRVYEQANQE